MLSNIPFQPFKYYIFNIKIAILYECVCVWGGGGGVNSIINETYDEIL